MRSFTLRRLTPLAALFLAVSLSGCALAALAVISLETSVRDPHPRVAACTGDEREAPRDGILTALPSRIPGLHLDSAAWYTLAQESGFTVTTRVISTAVLTSDREVPLDSVAVVFLSARRDHVGLLEYFYRPIFSSGRRYEDHGSRQVRVVLPATRQRIELAENVGLDVHETTLQMMWCPAFAQIVRRNEVVSFFIADSAIRRDSERLIARRSRSRDPSTVWPVEVLADSTTIIGYSQRTIAAAFNTTNDTVTDARVGFAIAPTIAGRERGNRYARTDTLWHRIAAIPPRDFAAVGGDILNLGEEIVGYSVELRTRAGSRHWSERRLPPWSPYQRSPGR